MRGVNQELEGAQAVVLDVRGDLDRCLVDAVSDFGRKPWRGRDLDQLLVAALDAAVALADMAHGAGGIADDLHLYVARHPHQLFDVNGAVSEGGLRLRLAAFEGLLQRVHLLDHAHASAAAAADGLDNHRLAGPERLEKAPRLIDGRSICRPGQHRDARASRLLPGTDLVAEELQHLHPRADEDNAFLTEPPRESGVLAQKAVARMNRIGSRPLGEGDDLFDVQIGQSTRALEWQGLVRLAGVQCLAIVFGIDRGCGDAELGCCAQDSDSDLAAIGDQKTPRKHVLPLSHSSM